MASTLVALPGDPEPMAALPASVLPLNFVDPAPPAAERWTAPLRDDMPRDDHSSSGSSGSDDDDDDLSSTSSSEPSEAQARPEAQPKAQSNAPFGPSVEAPAAAAARVQPAEGETVPEARERWWEPMATAEWWGLLAVSLWVLAVGYLTWINSLESVDHNPDVDLTLQYANDRSLYAPLPGSNNHAPLPGRNDAPLPGHGRDATLPGRNLDAGRDDAHTPE